MKLKEKIQDALINFLFQSLLDFKNDYDYGEDIFKELFFKRNESSDIDFSFSTKNNMTIIGNPGEGKTCLMHYMFLQTKQKKDIYPIILDYRKVYPKEIYGIIAEFIKQMILYFEEINAPITTISDQTNQENYQHHFQLVSKHLNEIKFSHIEKTKKLAIFLDDLDYMEKDYVRLLKQYFILYSRSDRSIVVLSGRKPLINTISADDELRQAYKLRVKPIYLADADLKMLLHSRINSIYSDKLEVDRYGKNILYKTKATIVNLLRKNALKYITDHVRDEKIEESDDIFKIDLGFDNLFFSYLSEITGKNLRFIEELFPEIYRYQISRDETKKDFNVNFCDAYIDCVSLPNYLLDIVSEKTISKKKNSKNNSILQIVLEYFFENEIKNNKFYQVMNEFGIDNVVADKAVKLLSKCPYSLIDPDFIYEEGNITLYERYKINRKGRFYITNIVTRKSYYKKLNTTPSSNRLIFKHAEIG